MADRNELISRFLDEQGWGRARRSRLAGDASFRRYERLDDGVRTIVFMDAPPPQEDVRPFLTVARRLKAMGYSAPEIHAEDVANGLLLIEDLGDDTFTRLLAKEKMGAGDGKGKAQGNAVGDDDAERALYTLAVDLLVDLHRQPIDLMGKDIPPYDLERFEDEHALFADWFLPAMRGRETPPSMRQSYLEIWRHLLALTRSVPEALVLRDYHVDNLMWLAGRDGVAACGLLDFQDALVGPCAYDLISLLEDARRDISRELVRDMRKRYLDAFPDLDREAFDIASAVLAAQRNCKIIGIFVRLCRRDGKADYLAHIPRVWRLLENDLEHPALALMKEWFGRYIPRQQRGIPPCQPAA